MKRLFFVLLIAIVSIGSAFAQKQNILQPTEGEKTLLLVITNRIQDTTGGILILDDIITSEKQIGVRQYAYPVSVIRMKDYYSSEHTARMVNSAITSYNDISTIKRPRLNSDGSIGAQYIQSNYYITFAAQENIAVISVVTLDKAPK